MYYLEDYAETHKIFSNGKVNSAQSNRLFYPSDQANFPRDISVAALKRSKRGLLYMDRIHTPQGYRLQRRKYLFSDGRRHPNDTCTHKIIFSKS